MTKHIDTNLLQIGQEFKNYPHLCHTLDIEVAKGGRNSKLQKQDLKRYFNWETEGRKITITEIYDTQKEKIDGRSNSNKEYNTIYGDFLDKILIDYIQNIENNTIHLTLNNIAIITNMVNENYQIAISNRALFSKYAKDKLNIHNESSIRNSFYNIRNIIRPAINSSIGRLARKGYIESRYGYIIAYKPTSKNQKEEDFVSTRMANTEEIKDINKIEKQVLRQYNVSTTKELNVDLLREYYDKVNTEIKMLFPNADKIFKGYEIIKFHSMNQVDTKDEDLEISKKTLNEIVLNRVSERFQKDVRKVTNRINKESNRTEYFGTVPPIFLKPYECEIIDESYILNGMIIVNCLVNASAVGIIEKNN